LDSPERGSVDFDAGETEVATTIKDCRTSFAKNIDFEGRWRHYSHLYAAEYGGAKVEKAMTMRVWLPGLQEAKLRQCAQRKSKFAALDQETWRQKPFNMSPEAIRQGSSKEVVLDSFELRNRHKCPVIQGESTHCSCKFMQAGEPLLCAVIDDARAAATVEGPREWASSE
jgi:hypothetical protein